MRISLELVPTVGHSLAKLEQRTRLPRSSLLHEALRLGVAQLEKQQAARTPFIQETLSAGAVRLENLDDIGGVLTALDEEE